jgi:hypothetical protein
MIEDIDVPARERSDPDVADDEQLGRLLGAGVTWERVVVLGDSIAAGVRESSPGYRDLGWSDRLAAGLALARPGAVVHNLGRRDLTAAEVRESQLQDALALEPDLAIVAAGGNDLLRREFDPRVVGEELAGILGPLRSAGRFAGRPGRSGAGRGPGRLGPCISGAIRPGSIRVVLSVMQTSKTTRTSASGPNHRLGSPDRSTQTTTPPEGPAPRRDGRRAMPPSQPPTPP